MMRTLPISCLALIATTGCLTSGVIYEAKRPSVIPVSISSVTGARLVDQRVIVELEVLRGGSGVMDHVEVVVPLNDLDWAADHAARHPWEVRNIAFVRPPRHDIHTPLSKNGIPLRVEPFDIGRMGELNTFRDGLPPGIHVLSLQDPTQESPAPSVPAILDTRDPSHPFSLVLSELPDEHWHGKWLLLLLPITAPVDALTFPVQIVVAVLVGVC